MAAEDDFFDFFNSLSPEEQQQFRYSFGMSPQDQAQALAGSTPLMFDFGQDVGNIFNSDIPQLTTKGAVDPYDLSQASTRLNYTQDVGGSIFDMAQAAFAGPDAWSDPSLFEPTTTYTGTPVPAIQGDNGPSPATLSGRKLDALIQNGGYEGTLAGLIKAGASPPNAVATIRELLSKSADATTLTDEDQKTITELRRTLPVRAPSTGGGDVFTAGVGLGPAPPIDRATATWNDFDEQRLLTEANDLWDEKNQDELATAALQYDPKTGLFYPGSKTEESAAALKFHNAGLATPFERYDDPAYIEKALQTIQPGYQNDVAAFQQDIGQQGTDWNALAEEYVRQSQEQGRLQQAWNQAQPGPGGSGSFVTNDPRALNAGGVPGAGGVPSIGGTPSAGGVPSGSVGGRGMPSFGGPGQQPTVAADSGVSGPSGNFNATGYIRGRGMPPFGGPGQPDAAPSGNFNATGYIRGRGMPSFGGPGQQPLTPTEVTAALATQARVAASPQLEADRRRAAGGGQVGYIRGRGMPPFGGPEQPDVAAPSGPTGYIRGRGMPPFGGAGRPASTADLIAGGGQQAPDITDILASGIGQQSGGAGASAAPQPGATNYDYATPRGPVAPTEDQLAAQWEASLGSSFRPGGRPEAADVPVFFVGDDKTPHLLTQGEGVRFSPEAPGRYGTLNQGDLKNTKNKTNAARTKASKAYNAMYKQASQGSPGSYDRAYTEGMLRHQAESGLTPLQVSMLARLASLGQRAGLGG